MRLFELFDQQYSYTWDYQTKGAWRGYFVTKNSDQVNVRIEKWKDAWKIEFSRNQTHNVTGSGDAIKIFSTVIAMAGEFIQAMKPNMLGFTADKSDANMSRTKLYDRLISRFAGKLGYTYETKTSDDNPMVIYNLIRKDKKI